MFDLFRPWGCRVRSVAVHALRHSRKCSAGCITRIRAHSRKGVRPSFPSGWCILRVHAPERWLWHVRLQESGRETRHSGKPTLFPRYQILSAGSRRSVSLSKPLPSSVSSRTWRQEAGAPPCMKDFFVAGFNCLNTRVMVPLSFPFFFVTQIISLFPVIVS